jgi:hypothetical protein
MASLIFKLKFDITEIFPSEKLRSHSSFFRDKSSKKFAGVFGK